MGESCLRSVVVTLRPAGADRTADREALVAAVASTTGADVAAVRAGRDCPHCGSTAHGRPWASLDGREVGVSLSRTSGVTALAVAPDAVGIDVERVSRVAAAPLDAFTPAELDRAHGDVDVLAACWAAKEAVLKRDGRGLRVDPRSVDVDIEHGLAVLAGVAQPVDVVRPGPDLVLAVAAGGLPVTWGA
ncbi:4'-phosphopantetheinyl transferase superfamily protein [Curtobacterium sp. 1P10AnD]|uniref:4'-phosphopantetheinyl transferase family protein n=1 Tax=Curtobacterium sp. 1P10AnD TaxID=3132283 RepID=UPI0039A01A54